MTTTTPGGISDDEQPIRAVEEAYDRAWEASDLDALVGCLDAGAVLVNPRGQVAVGHEEIRQVLGAFLGGEAKGTRHRSSIQRITLVRQDVAVVDGRAAISLPGADPIWEHPFTDILVERLPGQWVIAHVRAYQFETA